MREWEESLLSSTRRRQKTSFHLLLPSSLQRPSWATGAGHGVGRGKPDVYTIT